MGDMEFWSHAGRLDRRPGPMLGRWGLRRAFRSALIPGQTKLVMLESPTNPRMQICDIAALTAVSHEVMNPCPSDPSYQMLLLTAPRYFLRTLHLKASWSCCDIYSLT
jgi:hypothetical protein